MIRHSQAHSTMSSDHSQAHSDLNELEVKNIYNNTMMLVPTVTHLECGSSFALIISLLELSC